MASIELPLSAQSAQVDGSGKGQAAAPFFRQRFLALRLLVLLLGACLFAPGLSGPFLLDDAPNLTHSNIFVQSSQDCLALGAPALISPSGPLGRPVAMFSFALNHCLSGLDPAVFKGTNIALHALCAVMLMLLVSRVMQTPRFHRWRHGIPFADHLPLLVALGWLVSPLHVSVVLYVVQRMTILSTLFSLIGLYCYVSARLHVQSACNSRIAVAYAVSAAVCLPLAAFSKENGLLLPLLWLVLEFGCFARGDRSPRANRLLGGLLLGACFLAALCLAILWPQVDAWLERLYAFREFTLPERLATQTGALFWYARMTIAPDLASVGLFHDDFPILDPWTDPSPWLFGLAWMSLAALAFALRRRLPFLLLGLGLFLAGHAMESSFLPLEMVFEHRNHLPSVGIVLGLVMLLSTVLAKRPHLLAACMVSWIVVGGAAAAVRANDWSDNFELHARELENHPGSERAAVTLAGLLQNAYLLDKSETTGQASLELFERALSNNPESLPALTGRLSILSDMGRPTEAAYQKLLARLNAPRIHPATSGFVSILLDSALAGRGTLGGMQVVALAVALIENPAALSGTRLDMALRLAAFYAESLHDWSAALGVLDAVEDSVSDHFALGLLRQQLLTASADPRASEHLQYLYTLAQSNPWPWERAQRRALLRSLEDRLHD